MFAFSLWLSPRPSTTPEGEAVPKYGTERDVDIQRLPVPLVFLALELSRCAYRIMVRLYGAGA